MQMTALEKVKSLMEVIDLNKDNMPEKDYLQVCNILKDIYNDFEGRQNVDDDMELQYNNSDFIKHILSLLVIITNVANFILVFFMYDNVKRLIS
jgi:hypothetical protein